MKNRLALLTLAELEATHEGLSAAEDGLRRIGEYGLANAVREHRISVNSEIIRTLAEKHATRARQLALIPNDPPAGAA